MRFRILRSGVLVLGLLGTFAAAAADYSVTVFAGWRASTGIDDAVTGEQADIDDSVSYSIALERSLDAGRTLVFDAEEFRRRADDYGIAVTAFAPDKE